MKFQRSWRSAAVVLATVGALALGLSSTTGASASSSSTITFAEAPGAAPNWILPYTGYLELFGLQHQ